MVGLGHNGQESCLARVSIVNYHGYIVLDTFVRPRERVTDWRTWVSGVRPKDMNNARHFEDVQAEVAKLLDGKIVIGHAVENDTKVSRSAGAGVSIFLSKRSTIPGFIALTSFSSTERYSAQHRFATAGQDKDAWS